MALDSINKKYNARLAVIGTSSPSSATGESGGREVEEVEEDENERVLMGVAGGQSRCEGVEAVLRGIEAAISRYPKYGTSSPASQPARTQTSSISVMMNPYRQECSRIQR